jgi:hypothetical protein
LADKRVGVERRIWLIMGIRRVVRVGGSEEGQREGEGRGWGR